MKLYVLDFKHQKIITEWNREFTIDESILISDLIHFLKEHSLVNERYADLVLADSVGVEYEDGEPSLVIT